MTSATSRVEGVPDVSADWYRGIVGFAHEMPSWVRDLSGFTTENLLILFGLLFLVAAWRARRIGPAAMTLALCVPVAMVAAYALSEGIKSVLREDRPCRAVPNIQQTILECPEHTDWSLPSNHSTLAASAAVALVVAWRRTAILAALLALLEGFSRIFVGVHYPHDVLVGFLLGAAVAGLLLWIVTRIVVPRVEHFAERRAHAPDAPTRPLRRITDDRAAPIRGFQSRITTS